MHGNTNCFRSSFLYNKTLDGHQGEKACVSERLVLLPLSILYATAADTATATATALP